MLRWIRYHKQSDLPPGPSLINPCQLVAWDPQIPLIAVLAQTVSHNTTWDSACLEISTCGDINSLINEIGNSRFRRNVQIISSDSGEIAPVEIQWRSLHKTVNCGPTFRVLQIVNSSLTYYARMLESNKATELSYTSNRFKRVQCCQFINYLVTALTMGRWLDTLRIFSNGGYVVAILIWGSSLTYEALDSSWHTSSACRSIFNKFSHCSYTQRLLRSMMYKNTATSFRFHCKITKVRHIFKASGLYWVV